MTHDHAEEQRRQTDLDSYGIVDTLEEQAYDDLTRLAADVCRVPMALISFIDRDRSWFKSRLGMQMTQYPRETSFCEHLVLKPDEVLIVNDAMNDRRFCGHPMVLGEPHIRFYAGAPLISPTGHTLGAICALDTEPRELDATQVETLTFLATQVMEKLEERRAALGVLPRRC